MVFLAAIKFTVIKNKKPYKEWSYLARTAISGAKRHGFTDGRIKRNLLWMIQSIPNGKAENTLISNCILYSVEEFVTAYACKKNNA